MSDKAALAAKYQLSSVIQEIKTVLNTARRKAASQINRELLNTYWQIGQIICEYEQSQPERADYGKQTLKELSKALTREFGKGFSRSNLQNMRAFYFDLSKSPDAVWQIELVSLLRITLLC